MRSPKAAGSDAAVALSCCVSATSDSLVGSPPPASEGRQLADAADVAVLTSVSVGHMPDTVRSILLFAAAAVLEIGGAWLIWQGVREHRGIAWVGVGIAALAGYGFVATFQPDPNFGRILAAYGGVFVAGSLLWGVVADGFRPDRYDLAGACNQIGSYLDALNNWYIRRSRERFWAPGAVDADASGTAADKADAFDTLYTVLETVTRVAAPLIPLVGEEIWRGLTGGRSVHLEDWPDAASFPVDDTLVSAMDRVREIARSGPEDIELALDAAHGAAAAWGRTSVTERSGVLLRIADRMEANLTDLAVADPSVADITLVSIMKAIDVSVYDTTIAASKGDFDPTPYVGTLKNEGVKLSSFHDFESKVNPDLAAQLETIKKGIIDGTIPVESPASP